jgi:hypothetical protein
VLARRRRRIIIDINALSLSAGLCALGLAASPAVAEAPHAAAVDACSGHKGATATPVTAIDNGRGDSLVWLTDSDANLWLCSADASGNVYAYSMIFDDLLAGAGASLVEPIYLDEEGKPAPRRRIRSRWLRRPARLISKTGLARWWRGATTG